LYDNIKKLKSQLFFLLLQNQEKLNEKNNIDY